MTIVNTETIPGRNVVEVKGLVQGNTVRAKNIGRDIAAGLKNMVGGELKGYTELLTESRREAMSRMIAQAEALGANAVVNPTRESLNFRPKCRFQTVANIRRHRQSENFRHRSSTGRHRKSRRSALR